MKRTVSLTVNGRKVESKVDSDRTLLKLLREDLGLTGTKEGCEHGECGACTVILDGKAVTSCLVLAVDADGKSVLTVEGLANEGRLHPLQEQFIEAGAVQCGFCTPGMLMAAYGLLSVNPNPTREQVAEALDGNLCRCGSYVKIVDAVLAAARSCREAGEGKGRC